MPPRQLFNCRISACAVLHLCSGLSGLLQLEMRVRIEGAFATLQGSTKGCKQVQILLQAIKAISELLLQTASYLNCTVQGSKRLFIRTQTVKCA